MSLLTSAATLVISTGLIVAFCLGAVASWVIS
jgi:hypothetical protein